MIDTSPQPGRSRGAPGLSEQLQQIAQLDTSVWEMGAFDQKAFTSRRKVMNNAQVMQVMQNLGSQNVRSIDIEQALAFSRGDV